MTRQESLQLSLASDVLKRILTLLEILRNDEHVEDGDAAVEWVIEQLQGDQ